jgi:predicted GNAT family N-acyltransferase
MAEGETTRRTVDVAVVRPVRMEVLRAGMPPEASVMPNDDHPLAHHVAVSVGGDTVSVGTIIPDAPPWDPARPDAWRIRGMATRDGYRGRRLGGEVLADLLAWATDHGGTFVWCNARVGAIAFYERAGFVTRGETFITDEVEHIEMWRDL